MTNVYTDYLDNILDNEGFQQTISDMTQLLRPVATQFDAVAFRGMSGGLVAPSIARDLGKNLIVVRKRSERRHSPYVVEGARSKRYIIVDDFVGSGRTIRTIVKEIGRSPFDGIGPSRLVGIALYRKPIEYHLRSLTNPPYDAAKKEIQSLARRFDVWIATREIRQIIHPRPEKKP